MNSAVASYRRLLRAFERMTSEKAFRKRAINIGHLLSGDAASTVAGLGSMVLAARALGPDHFGVLALLLAFVQAFERIVSFQTWQPIIRYGAGVMADHQKHDFMQLIKFGYRLDLMAALCAWLVAISVATLGANIGITLFQDISLELVLIYAAVLPFALTGTSIGILRLTERFKLTAYVHLISGITRLVLCLIAYILGQGLLTIVVIWTVTHIMGSLVLVIAACRELHRRGLLNFLPVSLTGVTERFPGIWKFAWSANLSVTVRATAQQFDTLLVGALAGPAAAGFYHLAKRVGRIVLQAGMQVQSVVYPELAKLWSANAYAQFKRVMLQTEGLLFAFGAMAVTVLIFAAAPLLSALVGPDYKPVAPLVVVQMIAVTLVLSGSALRSALLTMGHEVKVLWIALLSTSAFFISAYVLVPEVGAMGANIAHVILGLITLAGFACIFQREFKSSQAGKADTSDVVAAQGEPTPAMISETDQETDSTNPAHDPNRPGTN